MARFWLTNLRTSEDPESIADRLTETPFDPHRRWGFLHVAYGEGWVYFTCRLLRNRTIEVWDWDAGEVGEIEVDKVKDIPAYFAGGRNRGVIAVRGKTRSMLFTALDAAAAIPIEIGKARIHLFEAVTELHEQGFNIRKAEFRGIDLPEGEIEEDSGNPRVEIKFDGNQDEAGELIETYRDGLYAVDLVDPQGDDVRYNLRDDSIGVPRDYVGAGTFERAIEFLSPFWDADESALLPLEEHLDEQSDKGQSLTDELSPASEDEGESDEAD